MALETVVVNLIDFFLAINYTEIVYTNLCKLSGGVCAVSWAQSRLAAPAGSAWVQREWVCRKTTTEESAGWEPSLVWERWKMLFQLLGHHVRIGAAPRLLFHCCVSPGFVKSRDRVALGFCTKDSPVSFVFITCIIARVTSFCWSPNVCSWKVLRGIVWSCLLECGQRPCPWGSGMQLCTERAVQGDPRWRVVNGELGKDQRWQEWDWPVLDFLRWRCTEEELASQGSLDEDQSVFMR